MLVSAETGTVLFVAVVFVFLVLIVRRWWYGGAPSLWIIEHRIHHQPLQLEDREGFETIFILTRPGIQIWFDEYWDLGYRYQRLKILLAPYKQAVRLTFNDRSELVRYAVGNHTIYGDNNGRSLATDEHVYARWVLGEIHRRLEPYLPITEPPVEAA